MKEVFTVLGILGLDQGFFELVAVARHEAPIDDGQPDPS